MPISLKVGVANRAIGCPPRNAGPWALIGCMGMVNISANGTMQRIKWPLGEGGTGDRGKAVEDVKRGVRVAWGATIRPESLKGPGTA